VEGFLAQAVALDAEHPDLHLRHAQLNLARGELDAAVARSRQALEKGRDLAEAHFTLGLALLCTGQREAAEGAYNAGLERAREWSELEDACQALERLMQARTDLAGATEILDRLRTARDELVARWPTA
jgi:tetratricopeptide (TPR) repeat protein